ncbi:MAG: transposase [Thermofilaceae archaeon]
MDEETRKRIRTLVEIYYDVQDVRIRTANRLRQVGRVEGVDPDALKDLEKEIAKRIEEEIEDLPIYKEYLSKIKGIGPVLAAGLITTFDVRKAEHPSSFWKYAGLHVEGGRAVRRRRGEKTDYNPKAKVLAWKVGRALLMARNEFYTKMYEHHKKREAEKLNHPEEDPKRCPMYEECAKKLKKAERPACAMHIHLRALRKVVKHFLAELFINWRQMEGLPVSPPYCEAMRAYKREA